MVSRGLFNLNVNGELGLSINGWNLEASVAIASLSKSTDAIPFSVNLTANGT